MFPSFPHASALLSWEQDDGFGNLIPTSPEHAEFLFNYFLNPEH